MAPESERAKKRKIKKTNPDTRVRRALAVLTEDRPAEWPEDDHANRHDQMDEAIAILRERKPKGGGSHGE